MTGTKKNSIRLGAMAMDGQISLKPNTARPQHKGQAGQRPASSRPSPAGAAPRLGSSASGSGKSK